MAKVSKVSVNYGPGRPKGDHCALCNHFEPPRACALVAGEITSGMWCKLFDRKPGAGRRKPKQP